jgi:lipopolysaccharide export LptBFGC system permease protein LptF
MQTNKSIWKSSLIITLISVIISSCTQSPSNAAKSYLEAVKNNEFEKAKSYATKDLQENLTYSSNSADIDLHKDRSFDIVSEKINGDMANVSFKTINKGIANPEEQTIRLVKQDGKWLVSNLDPGKREREDNEKIEQLKVELKSLTDELNTYNDKKLSTDLTDQKLKLNNSLKGYKDSVQIKLTFVQQIKLEEDIKQTRYYLTKFMAQAEEFNRSK